MSKNKIPLILENEFLIIANKPAGTLSVPSRLGEYEKRAILKTLLEAQLNCRLWAAHRLDYEVSGLILFAKNADVHRAANAWFEKQLIRKTYSAMTEGDPVAAAAFSQPTQWQSYIVRGKKRAFAAPYGQEAITIAQFKGANDKGLIWELRPLTGRGHQLRYELSHHGFPILGDALYGAKLPFVQDAIALTATAINFSQCPEREKYALPEEVVLPE